MPNRTGPIDVFSGEASVDVAEEEEAALDFPDTSGFPTLGMPTTMLVEKGELRRRLRTESEEPALQAILDSLSRHLLSDLSETRRLQVVTALESAMTIDAMLATIIATGEEASTRRFQKKLVKMDRESYNREWSCPDCSRRWGRHNAHTLACPKVNPIERGELDG